MIKTNRLRLEIYYGALRNKIAIKDMDRKISRVVKNIFHDVYNKKGITRKMIDCYYQ